MMAAVVLGSACAVKAVPTVSNVSMAQIADTRRVEITYDLGVEDAIITLSIETNGVAIPDSAVTWLYGDVCKVVTPGEGRSITWNAGKDWPENVTEAATAKITAWSTNAPPLYCAVDVLGGPGATTYPVYYYMSAEAVPRGVTNNLYKTDRILMRRLDPTDSVGFMMGSPTNEVVIVFPPSEDRHQVTLTKGFYAGVYEVTQSQWQHVMGDVLSWPSHWNNPDYRLMRPVDSVSYNDIRGSVSGAGWPGNNTVDNNTFIGRVRNKTGLTGFDLPTDAQLEYACRAGTTGAYNDGTIKLTDLTSSAQLNLLARYASNNGNVQPGNTSPAKGCEASNATAIVGTYLPNAWGLYDTHGNVIEWCLDWFTDHLGTLAVEDPRGPTSGANRVIRGGGWSSSSYQSRSAFRQSTTSASRATNIGLRLVRTLP